MAKLYFRHGAMSSAKTLNLLATAHSYESQGKKILLMKPSLDTRFGVDVVQSRAGLERKADILLTAETRDFEAERFRGISCVLVDEAQFVQPRVIESLRNVAANHGVPVICFGLRTDFRSRLFPGSKRLMELADCIEEVKTTCHFCNRKATMNLKSVNGRATMDGPTVCLGAEEMYVSTCYGHFCEKISEATDGKPVDFEAAWIAGDLADAKQAGNDTPELRDCDSADAQRVKEAPALDHGSPRGRRAVHAEPEMETSPAKDAREH